MTNPATMPEAVLPTSRSAREASRFSLQGFFRSRRRPAAASLLTLANLATLVLCSKRGIRAMGPCRNLGGAWADHQIVTAKGAGLRREKTSVSQEDYLKAIWEMLEDEQTPISARLAEELGVSPPAVT